MIAPALAAPRASLSPDQLGRIQKASQDFEAVALQQLLAPMFQTINMSKTVFGGGDGEDAWRPMWIDAVAKQMAANGGIGLAAPIMQQMIAIQEHRNDQQ